jgi:small subunit ribosomal protein S6e
VELKLVVADGAKSYPRTVGESQAAGFLGKRIGEEVGGELIGLPGYTLRVRGASDRSGFPLRPDLLGSRQVRILVGQGFGFNAPRRGQRRRRTFRGNQISEETVQINLVVQQKGPKPLGELFGTS